MYNNQYNPYANNNAASLSAVSPRMPVSAAGSLAPAAVAPVDNLNRDPNPIVIRKKTAPVQYTQNVSVRFLKPPPLPPQGKVIVKQEPDIILPPPPPLVIRKYHRLAKVSPNAPPTAATVNVAQGPMNQFVHSGAAVAPGQFGFNNFAPTAQFNPASFSQNTFAAAPNSFDPSGFGPSGLSNFGPSTLTTQSGLNLQQDLNFANNGASPFNQNPLSFNF